MPLVNIKCCYKNNCEESLTIRVEASHYSSIAKFLPYKIKSKNNSSLVQHLPDGCKFPIFAPFN